jgi:hypothetical protein
MSRVLLLAVLLSLSLLSVSGQATPGTICAKYVGSVDNGTTELALVSAVVVRAVFGGSFTVANSTYTIDGIIQRPTTSGNPNPIYAYFDSSIAFKPNPSNYTANNFNNAAFTALATHLFSYFGAFLGCIPASNGWNSPVANSDMYGVHRSMGLNQTHMNYFIAAVAGSLLSFGVSSGDVATAGAALQVFERCGGFIVGNAGGISSTALNQICSAPGLACNNATSPNCALYATQQSEAVKAFSPSTLLGLFTALLAAVSILWL